MKIKKVYIGGWFQRTTLHLTEVWDVFKYGKSELDFPKKELESIRKLVGIQDVTRENGKLEYVRVVAAGGIEYRMYEDGLIILEKEITVLSKDIEVIKSYYDNRLSKALSLIFSKGAPVPKELANIQTILPYILTVEGATKLDVQKLYKDFKQEIYSTLKTQNVEVYRGAGLIVINNLKDQELTREIIESQIFFREFKTQLHRYLAIHRVIWEKIARIKERGYIVGTEVDAYRSELSDIQKTVDLIGARINQMGVYIRTRQKITDVQNIDTYLNPLFQFKFETLQDTQEYIKYLWDMTKQYLASALESFTEIQNKSTKNSIASLQVITTIGVVAAILGYLGRDAWPKFTAIGVFYFILLLLMTGFLNWAISRAYRSKRYRIGGSVIVKNIK
ncbi:MAG: hypothetical protein JNK33_01125 [Candidatus Doudnabacteria bacterium]|nr:hypothetical protein [Candidatus Doudnabacteria bacterium]